MEAGGFESKSEAGGFLEDPVGDRRLEALDFKDSNVVDTLSLGWFSSMISMLNRRASVLAV